MLKTKQKKSSLTFLWVLSNISLDDLDESTKGIPNMFTGNIKLGGSAGLLEGEKVRSPKWSGQTGLMDCG